MLYRVYKLLKVSAPREFQAIVKRCRSDECIQCMDYIVMKYAAMMEFGRAVEPSKILEEIKSKCLRGG